MNICVCNVKESIHPGVRNSETCWGEDNRPHVGLEEESGIRSWDRQMTGIRELPVA